MTATIPAQAASADTIGARTYIGLFLFVLAAHGLWFVLSGFPDEFVDSDGYVRVLRVEMLWQGGDWFANALPRNNAPFGDVSHFTRPLDVLISILAVPLVPVLGVKPAIFWAGALSGPVLHAGCAAAIVWAALPLAGREGAKNVKPGGDLSARSMNLAATAAGRTVSILAGIFVSAQGMIWSYAIAMRSDHHILFLFLVAAGFGCMTRALDRERADFSYALAAGVLAAAGIWVGVEGLAYAGLCAMAFGLFWLGDNDGRRGLAFAAAFAAGLIGALLLERGADVLTVEHERLSIVHATLGVLVLAGFALLHGVDRIGAGREGATTIRPGGGVRALSWNWAAYAAGRDWRLRVILGGICGALILAAWYGLFPSLGRGPMADFDPEVVARIFATTSEYAPGWRPDRFPLTLGATVLAAPWLVWKFSRDRAARTNQAWLHLAACVAFYGAITATWGRWGIYAALFSSVVLAEMAFALTERIQARGRTRFAREAGCALAMAAFLIGPLGLALGAIKLFTPPERLAHLRNMKACAAKPLAAALSRPPWSDRSRVVATGANIGGEIMYRTPHGVVASLYLKGYEGLRDLNRFFAATDETAARATIDKRKIELIAVCPAFGIEWMGTKDTGPDTIYGRLAAGRPPSWIREVALPAEASAYRLFEVLSGAGR